MQNDKVKCGLTEESSGKYVDDISIEAYVWFEENWHHDVYEHTHQRYQLTYVTEGYQYFHIEQKIYLVPQNHVIWIPTQTEHRTTSEAKAVRLMVVLFQSVPEKYFYQDVHVFPAPAVLKEMLLYASKWNKLLTKDDEQALFLKAMLHILSHFVPLLYVLDDKSLVSLLISRNSLHVYDGLTSLKESKNDEIFKRNYRRLFWESRKRNGHSDFWPVERAAAQTEKARRLKA